MVSRRWSRSRFGFASALFFNGINRPKMPCATYSEVRNNATHSCETLSPTERFIYILGVNCTADVSCAVNQTDGNRTGGMFEGSQLVTLQACTAKMADRANDERSITPANRSSYVALVVPSVGHFRWTASLWKWHFIQCGPLKLSLVYYILLVEEISFT